MGSDKISSIYARKLMFCGNVFPHYACYRPPLRTHSATEPINSKTLTSDEFLLFVILVLNGISEELTIFMVLKPPGINVESSTGRPYPNKHECIDTGDGNYTCTGSMNGMYLCIPRYMGVLFEVIRCEI